MRHRMRPSAGPDLSYPDEETASVRIECRIVALPMPGAWPTFFRKVGKQEMRSQQQLAPAQCFVYFFPPNRWKLILLRMSCLCAETKTRVLHPSPAAKRQREKNNLMNFFQKREYFLLNSLKTSSFYVGVGTACRIHWLLGTMFWKRDAIKSCCLMFENFLMEIGYDSEVWGDCVVSWFLVAC